MTGYTIDELVDADLHALLHHHDSNARTANIGCALSRGWCQNTALRDHQDSFVSRNGQTFPVVCNARTVQGAATQNDTVLEVRDVTAEHRAAREVAESQALFRQLAETIPQLAVMAQADGAVIWFNQRWFDYTGSTLEEAAGWGWARAHDPAVLPEVMETWQASPETVTPFSTVAPLRGADGTYRPFLIRMKPFRDESGALVRWFGTCTDVSEERALTEELRRREMGMAPALCDLFEGAIERVFATGEIQRIEFSYDEPSGPAYFVGHLSPEPGPDGGVEYVIGVTRDCTAERVATMALEESNRRKDEFLATLSHELRNPLAPIRNALEILRLSSDDERTAAMRTIMDRQVFAMTRLVDDLLDISRINLGKLELIRARVSLASVLDDAIEVSRPRIDAARHRLVQRRSEEDMRFDADGSRLSQAIGNLLINAAKYTPDQGEITIRTTRDGNDAVISISDTGVGIPESMLHSIFDMFMQISDAPLEPKVGLGIGLALVRQLVELHDGQVHAESSGSGMGSTFVVRLPLANHSATATGVTPDDGGGRRSRDRLH